MNDGGFDKRRNLARKYRRKGMTFFQIGEKLGVSRQRAHQLFRESFFVKHNDIKPWEIVTL